MRCVGNGAMTSGERIEFNHMTAEKVLNLLVVRMCRVNKRKIMVKRKDFFTKDIIVGCAFPSEGKIELKFPI